MQSFEPTEKTVRSLSEEREELGTILRVIRCKRSGEYFTDEGWTQTPEEARSFADGLEAAKACARHGVIWCRDGALVAGRGV